ncbi:MAG: transcriptional regulator GcvA [Gammaproteobacteria bacterium]|nr:transcriptional regulator GcvA [Gammaproteobacteria bacterium]
MHKGRSQGLPPLRAVRAFVVAARHMSLTRAAEELFVTQSAVSRQIRELETDLGVTLFERRGRNLRLTAEGRALAWVAGDALDRLTEEAIALRTRRSGPVVTLSMLPSVAARWLAPRLADFITAHPDIDLRIAASRQFTDFETEGVDAAIRYGLGDWPSVAATHLADEEIVPVCSPAYAHEVGLVKPADLAQASLLHGDLPEDWRDWFRAAGVTDPVPRRGPHFGDANALLQAATDGLGVALGRSLLVADDLRAGRLVEPFGPRLQARYAYWFVLPRSQALSERLVRVRDWLTAQFANTS